MSADIPSIRLSAPFAKTADGANSSRYHWKNDKRGDQEFVIIQWTHEGRGKVRFKGRNYDTTPGTAFIAIVPEPSAYYYPPGADAPWRFSWVSLYGDIAKTLCRALRETHGPVLPLRRDEAAGNALASLIRQSEKRGARDAYEASVEVFAFLMAWTRSLSRPSTRRVDAVEAAMQICRTRFREPLAVKQLADEVGVTREHLTREFLRRVKVSPALYLRGLRVRAARQMLEDHGVTQTEAALRCGFPSPKAMSRAFGR